ncbi:MAG: hypothetical protein NVS4B11_17030 [Ktedonobacteraceae bacterium]
MTAFLVTVAIIGGLIVIGLFVNVYLYSQGVFRRRRARRVQQQQGQGKRVTTAGLDEQFYTSLGIGPTNPVDKE